MGYKGDGWRKGGLGYLRDIQKVAGIGRCRKGLGRILNHKTTKGYVISSLGGGYFSNLGARGIKCVEPA
jgi:hypothetical protein